MKDNVQEKMQSATNTLKNSMGVDVKAGPGLGIKVKAGDVGFEAGVNGPQAKISLNPAGEPTTEANAGGFGVKISTPVGDAKAGTNLWGFTIVDGKFTTTGIESGASALPSVSTQMKDVNTSTKADVNSSGEISVGANLGFFGIVAKLNPVNLIVGAVKVLETIITYKVESVKENSSNPLINRDVNRGPGN